MALPATAELARQSASEIADLKKDVEKLLQQVDQMKLQDLQIELAVLNQRFVQMEKASEELNNDRIAELKKSKEEADRRYWQFVVLFVGGILTLAINLVVSFIRK